MNKIGDRITFKIKIVYYLQLLTPTMIKLLGSSKSKINKDVNGENMPHLEITGEELVPSSIFNKIVSINRIRESYVHLLPVNCLINY